MRANSSSRARARFKKTRFLDMWKIHIKKVQIKERWQDAPKRNKEG